MTILSINSKDGATESFYLKRGLSAEELGKVKHTLNVERHRARAKGRAADLQHALHEVLGFTPDRVQDDGDA